MIRGLVVFWVLVALLYASFGSNLAKGWSRMIAERHQAITREAGE